MSDWIPFEEGEYALKRAYVIAADRSATTVENGVLRVYTGRSGKKYLNGAGLIQNALLVELLNVDDELDLLLDLGDDYKYLMKHPHLKAGKVFSPNVKSMLQFTPDEPWHPLSAKEFDNMLRQLKIISF
jgi:hypothetical protein